jgi:hypothetical protein
MNKKNFSRGKTGEGVKLVSQDCPKKRKERKDQI